MKKLILKIILILNALLWTILSVFNYINIYQQMKTDIMKLIVWSPVIILMYMLILRVSSLLIERIYYILNYHKIKSKYMNKLVLIRQILFLNIAVWVIYGLCYYSSDFLGIIPLVLFFSKKLMQTGKFYVYHNGRLLLFDEKSGEYIVKSINSLENRIVVQEMKGINPKTIVLDIKKPHKEEVFLNSFHWKLDDSQEVA